MKITKPTELPEVPFMAIDTKKPGVDSASIRVNADGPYLVSGGVPLIKMVIVSDSDGTAREWREVEKYSLKASYALCRCGQSSKKPFCDGTHMKAKFKGEETSDESYLKSPDIYDGPALRLTDHEPLCASARFCHRAGGIWALIKKTDDSRTKTIVIQESADCPSGRLVISERANGAVVEPSYGKSIVVVEDPAGGGLGPYWVRGGIPIRSSEGRVYEVGNRVTLCRCGKSKNKPFCDSSHYNETHTHG
jgi:CDGSH-type Zn-finger protein